MASGYKFQVELFLESSLNSTRLLRLLGKMLKIASVRCLSFSWIKNLNVNYVKFIAVAIEEAGVGYIHNIVSNSFLENSI